VIDEALYASGAIERQEQRPPTTADIPGLRGFVARAPGLNSESVQRFRTKWREIDRTYQTIQLLEREERTEQLEKELEDPRVQELLDLYGEFNALNARLSAAYAEANIVERDPLLSPQEKIEEINRIGEDITAELREAIGRELPSDRSFFGER
jgi:hypothetical protein